MRPPAPRQSSRPGGPGSRPRRAIVGAFALALGASCVSLVVACASAPGSPPRRNRMEAPPPFPVAPDFSLPDALGAPQTLSSLMGPRGLVLVLYRGHW